MDEEKTRMSLTKGFAKKFAPWAVAVLAVIALSAGSALADSCIPSATTECFSLTTGNTAISPYTGPYGTVQVTLTSPTTATVTFTNATNGDYIYLFTHTQAADLNVNGPYTVSALSSSNSISGFTAGIPISSFNSNADDTGSGNVSSFGDFNLTIDSFDGFTHSEQTITFQLTLTEGTWASVSDVLTPNADGNEVAAGIGVCESPCSSTGGFVSTGFATAGEPSTPVPEPASIALFGSGLMTLAGMIRRRRKQAKS
jgi:PEP-CTERM motif